MLLTRVFCRKYSTLEGLKTSSWCTHILGAHLSIMLLVASETCAETYPKQKISVKQIQVKLTLICVPKEPNEMIKWKPARARTHGGIVARCLAF